MDSRNDCQSLIIASGIMTPEELGDAYQAALADRTRWHNPRLEALCTDPYFLAGASLGRPTGAVLWAWDASKTGSFCEWTSRTLSERFGLEAYIEADAGAEPERLWIRHGEHEEVCNWRTINRVKWMGAFCIMSNRLLADLGVMALELETGGFDTVVAFARAIYADKLSLYLPVAE